MEKAECHLTQVIFLRPNVVDDDAPLLVQLLVGKSGVEQAVRHQVKAAMR